MEWLEVAAPSVEAAKEIALDSLGVHESDAEFEIITEGKMGLFGRVKEDARVRARILPIPVRPKTTRTRSNRRSKPSTKHHGKSSTRHSVSDADDQYIKRTKNSSQQVPTSRTALTNFQKPRRSKKVDQSLGDQADLVESFVAGIAEMMDLNLEFTRYKLENDSICIEAIGDDIGILIGQRGATAKAINDLSRTILQRSGHIAQADKISVDIGGVEFRRHAALSEFVKSIAAEVLESGEEIRVEPMNRIDRKIIHDIVAEIDGIGSRSEGNNTLRHVVIGVYPPNR